MAPNVDLLSTDLATLPSATHLKRHGQSKSISISSPLLKSNTKEIRRRLSWNSAVHPYQPQQQQPRNSPLAKHQSGSDANGALQPPREYTGPYVLVTGGAGFIGSHTVLELLKEGYRVIVVDNLCNSSEESLRRVLKLSGRPPQHLLFLPCDITSFTALDAVFSKYNIWAVLHFAALKAVGESTRIPLSYYHNNVSGSITLFQVMEKHNVRNIVFSSSATVYGDSEQQPVSEDAPIGEVTNPYGKTKYFVEEMLRDMCAADKRWNAVLLRYFNPVGAHPSGLIGEDPRGIPNNLMPYVARVVQGQLPFVRIFGNDYATRDGTGVRDYIHVCDLASGHVAALKRIKEDPGCVAYNLGTGTGYSVLEIVQAMSKAAGVKIPYKIVDRRSGDVGTSTADATLAMDELGWKPRYSLDQMCEDLWRWTITNPHGYDSA
ncbi:uncharacterized protein VTP21DRAFT_5242 [Calcarisporiella thermophila]|uniref:uncharacterized protein n=1 Tax=Calcarisporiella thermophila TaxID=911321 RepID=UPI0037444595